MNVRSSLTYSSWDVCGHSEAVLNFSKKFSWLDVSVFVCALGDFLVLSAPVLRQIARYLPHRSENASKTHPKSSHDKFKTASKPLWSGSNESPQNSFGASCGRIGKQQAKKQILFS